ncbi:serine protease [Patescibacteria group bacterium]|nr:serine protease [Patescibacteria group bacterium]
MRLTTAILTVRESVVAIFRYRESSPATVVNGVAQPAQFECGWGSGFCIVANRYVMTAFHVLNGGAPRNPADKFIAFVVPSNGNTAYHFPVIGFPLEKPDMDIAVLEIGPPAVSGIVLPALPITLSAPPDGSSVLTLGFPAPEIAGLNIDPLGNYVGGNFFLKSHANEGILSAQYPLGALNVYEFNVGWHHGESGGPVVQFESPLAVLTMMQQYRQVSSPHGIMAGPHRGCSFADIRQELLNLGAQIV